MFVNVIKFLDEKEIFVWFFNIYFEMGYQIMYEI